MIQIATSLPAISAGPARPVLLAAQSGASNFALALSSLLVPGGAVARELGEASAAGLPAAERQAVAEPGKELPEVALDTGANEEAPEQNSEADDEEAPAGEDLTFAWFATPAAPVAPPIIAPKAAAIDEPRAAIELPEASRTGEIAPVRPEPVIAPPAEGEAAPDRPAQPVVAGETHAKAVPPAARVAAEPVAGPGPRAAPLPQRRAERPLAIVPRPAPPADAVETPQVPVAAAASSGVLARTSATAPVSAPVLAVAPVPAPATATPAPVAAVTASPIPAPDGAAQPPAPDTAAQAPAAQAAAPGAIEPSAPRAQAPAPAVQSARQPAPELAQPLTATPPIVQAAAQGAPAQPLTAAPLIVQAAAQGAPAQPIAFAPLHRAFREAEQPAVTSIAAPAAPVLQQVAAAPDAQQGTLDMRRQEWLGKMVETIEAMREAAPIKETRLRLVPDALGKVDISVRQEGDRVHVHIAAETQAARQILTDAQPRLTELAEQRGIRLGQTSVDMGQAGANAQSGQRHNEAQRPQTPSAPASARAAKDQLTQSDDRVA